MRPTFKEMLAGIETVQAMVVLPRIMATGEMDVLKETGFSYRLLGFLQQSGGRMLDIVLRENRETQALFRQIGPEVAAGIGSLGDPGLSERCRSWSAAGLPAPAVERAGECGDTPFLELAYQENAALKGALNELILLLDETDRAAPQGAAAPWRQRAEQSVRQVIRENVARQSALTEELLKLWRG